MKKKLISLGIVLCLGLMCCIGLTGCLFDPKVKKLEVEYTKNLQFFVGEEWHDDLVKGIATYTDGETKDVTAELNIDTSDYDKTQPGTYDIVFEFGGIDLKYQVEVVEEMTSLPCIFNRIEPCFQKAFKAQDGVLEFSASYAENVIIEGYEMSLTHTMQYKCEDGVKQYYKVDISYLGFTESIEYLYEGTDEENGTLTGPVEEGEGFESTPGSMSDFETRLMGVFEEVGCTAQILASSWLNFYNQIYPGLNPSKLSKTDDVYTITLADEGTISIDVDGFVQEFYGVEFVNTTNIPDELTAA